MIWSLWCHGLTSRREICSAPQWLRERGWRSRAGWRSCCAWVGWVGADPAGLPIGLLCGAWCASSQLHNNIFRSQLLCYVFTSRIWVIKRCSKSFRTSSMALDQTLTKPTVGYKKMKLKSLENTCICAVGDPRLQKGKNQFSTCISWVH
jgi:hypothetical protein